MESRHEKSQARLKEKIKKLEEKAIGDKPWQMGGEVAAPVRSHSFQCRNNTLLCLFRCIRFNNAKTDPASEPLRNSCSQSRDCSFH